MKYSLWGLLNLMMGRVQIKELDKITITGGTFPVLLISGQGVSEDYKTIYVVDVDGEFLDVEAKDVHEFIYKNIWVSKDSLGGILSLATFDPKDIQRYYKEKK